MYVMFAFFPSISPSFKIYFENYNYLSFSVRDIIKSFQKLIDRSYSTNNIKNYSKVLNIFPEAVVFLIIFLLVVLLLMKKKHICLFKIWRKSSLFSVWLFLIIKFLSLSIILNLWTFYEAKSLFDAASIICSIILWIWITLYYYWWILNYKREWMLWKRYALFSRLNINFTIFDDVKSENYYKFILANQLMKAIVLIFLIIWINGYLAFLYIGKQIFKYANAYIFNIYID